MNMVSRKSTFASLDELGTLNIATIDTVVENADTYIILARPSLLGELPRLRTPSDRQQGLLPGHRNFRPVAV